MFDSAGKDKITVFIASTGLLVGLTVGAVHAADQGMFVTSSAGEGVKTGYGECWNAVGGTPAVADCIEDGDADGDGVPDSRDRCPNTPKGVAVDADGCPLEAPAPVSKMMVHTTAGNFDFDSAMLKPEMEAELDSVAGKASASKGGETLEIVGHTDSTGPEGYNQGLSERRAQAAADYLAGKGVSASMMTIKGMGESSPVADNSTREGRAQNRRVEIMSK